MVLIRGISPPLFLQYCLKPSKHELSLSVPKLPFLLDAPTLYNEVNNLMKELTLFILSNLLHLLPPHPDGITPPLRLHINPYIAHHFMSHHSICAYIGINTVH